MPKPLTVWITINCGKFFKPIDKYDIQWSDHDWPKVVTFRNVSVERETLDLIISEIKK